MTEELKPCPFCGADAKLMGGPKAQETYSVWCENRHHINGTMCPKDTVEEWNTRATPDPALFREMATFIEVVSARKSTDKTTKDIARIILDKIPSVCPHCGLPHPKKNPGLCIKRTSRRAGE